MATISSTVSLVDNISSKLTTIKGNLDEVVSAFESMQTPPEMVSGGVYHILWELLALPLGKTSKFRIAVLVILC